MANDWWIAMRAKIDNDPKQLPPETLDILAKLKIKADNEASDDLLPNLEAGQRGSLIVNFWISNPLISRVFFMDFLVARDT